ncbi:hypothetical protein [Thermomonas brevis]
MTPRNLALASLLTLALTACGPEAAWKGWVYPDSENLENYVQVGPFQSFEACQDTAQRVMTYMSKAEQRLVAANQEYEAKTPDYECGYKCELDLKLEMNVCEKTAK